jgi:putative flippase GtrA
VVNLNVSSAIAFEAGIIVPYVSQCLLQFVIVEHVLLRGLLAEAVIDDIFLVLQQ